MRLSFYRSACFLFLFSLTGLFSKPGWGSSPNEVAPATEGRPYAPLDVSQESHEDPYRTLTPEEREDFLGEFKGLVHMGMEKTSYDRWSGKSMSDCESAGNNQAAGDWKDRWQYKCEIITGEGNGFYYFYPDESRRAFMLQRVDVRLHTGDHGLLNDVRRSLQTLFGRSSSVDGHYRWETAEDVAELFVESPEGDSQKLIRFVWNRAPLGGNRQALAR